MHKTAGARREHWAPTFKGKSSGREVVKRIGKSVALAEVQNRRNYFSENLGFRTL